MTSDFGCIVYTCIWACFAQSKVDLIISEQGFATGKVKLHQNISDEAPLNRDFKLPVLFQSQWYLEAS